MFKRQLAYLGLQAVVSIVSAVKQARPLAVFGKYPCFTGSFQVTSTVKHSPANKAKCFSTQG